MTRSTRSSIACSSSSGARYAHSDATTVCMRSRLCVCVCMGWSVRMQLDDVTMKHDASRLVQWSIRFGKPEQKNAVMSVRHHHCVFICCFRRDSWCWCRRFLGIRVIIVPRVGFEPQELRPQLLELSKAKHGHQLVQCVLQHGTAEMKLDVAKAFKGHVLHLATNHFGAVSWRAPLVTFAPRQ